MNFRFLNRIISADGDDGEGAGGWGDDGDGLDDVDDDWDDKPVNRKQKLQFYSDFLYRYYSGSESGDIERETGRVQSATNDLQLEKSKGKTKNENTKQTRNYIQLKRVMWFHSISDCQSMQMPVLSGNKNNNRIAFQLLNSHQ